MSSARPHSPPDASGNRVGLSGHPDGYVGFFRCFNTGLYFEAHEVLEAVWLPQRRSPDGDFYKGLIQIAGAFVHLQKLRLGPAAALLRLARRNLAKYPVRHRGLDVSAVIRLTDTWMEQLEAGAMPMTPAADGSPPHLDPPALEN